MPAVLPASVDEVMDQLPPLAVVVPREVVPLNSSTVESASADPVILGSVCEVTVSVFEPELVSLWSARPCGGSTPVSMVMLRAEEVALEVPAMSVAFAVSE